MRPLECIICVTALLGGCVSAEIKPLVGPLESAAPRSHSGIFEVPRSMNDISEDAVLVTPNTDQKLLARLTATNPIINSNDIATAVTEVGVTGMPQVILTLTPKGTQAFRAYTSANIGKTLAIIIDDKIISMPRLVSEILDGRISLMGRFTFEEASDLAKRLTTASNVHR